VPRVLLTIWVLVMAFAVSGFSTAFAAAAMDDDCCAEDCCGDRSSGEQPDGHQPSDRGKGCSPLCHSCTCAPTFAVPMTHIVTPVITTFVTNKLVEVGSQLPVNPPGGDIFHPPRLSA
jgi:hypothetical protein